MRLKQRLDRLESLEQGRVVLLALERIADEHGRDPDEVLQLAQEIGERIERWGLDAEVRRFARDHGLTEDEVRARIDAAREKYGL